MERHPIPRASAGMIAVLTLACLLLRGGVQARAGDAEDTRDIVGSWSAFLADTVEFKKDGTYKFKRGGSGTWRIQNGKLVTTTILGTSKSDFTLGKDTLVWMGETRTRNK